MLDDFSCFQCSNICHHCKHLVSKLTIKLGRFTIISDHRINPTIICVTVTYTQTLLENMIFSCFRKTCYSGGDLLRAHMQGQYWNVCRKCILSSIIKSFIIVPTQICYQIRLCHIVYIAVLVLCQLKDRLCQRTRNSGLFSHVCLYPTLVQSITRAQEYFSLLSPTRSFVLKDLRNGRGWIPTTRAFDLKT